MLSPQFVNAKELRVAIGELNSTGLMDPKIRTVGVKKEALLEVFINGVKSVPEAEEGKLAESTILFFNSIVEGKDPSPEEIEAKKTKEKKPKVASGPSNEQKGLELTRRGASDEEWNKVFGEFYALKGVTDEKFIASRIAIYKNIGKKLLAKEGAPKADKEEAAPPTEKEAVKPTAKKTKPAVKKAVVAEETTETE